MPCACWIGPPASGDIRGQCEPTTARGLPAATSASTSTGSLRWCRPARLSASGGEITTRPVRTAAVASSRRHGSPPTIGAKAASPRYLQRRALPVITDTADGAGQGAQTLCPGRPREPTGLIFDRRLAKRSEEHTSELQSLMRISYAVFCLKKKNNT